MAKILIIDDEPEAVFMLSDFISARGFTTVTAKDGEEGLSKFDSEKPDLIICDIKMPKKDGFKFIQEMRASRKWVPVIFVTAVSDVESVMKGYNLEADHYLTKPVDLEDLLRSINIMLSLIPLRIQQ